MKSKSGQDLCKCSECERRFDCFTSERIFSDPILQGLYEALVSQEGWTRAMAVDAVANELKSRLTPQAITVQGPWQPITTTDITWTTTSSSSVGSQWVYATPQSCAATNWVADGNNITYTMVDGKEVKWTSKLPIHT